MSDEKYTTFWDDSTAKGIKTKCLYEWESGTYTVEVSYGILTYRYVWRYAFEPIFGMNVEDIIISQREAARLVKQIEEELGS